MLTNTASERPLPACLLDELQNPRPSDRHSWFFWCAVRLSEYRDQRAVLELLRTAAKHVGRHVPDREIQEAVKDAIRWRATHRPADTPLQKILQAEMRSPSLTSHRLTIWCAVDRAAGSAGSDQRAVLYRYPAHGEPYRQSLSRQSAALLCTVELEVCYPSPRDLAWSIAHVAFARSVADVVGLRENR